MSCVWEEVSNSPEHPRALVHLKSTEKNIKSSMTSLLENTSNVERVLHITKI
jgi:hypothetical protein